MRILENDGDLDQADVKMLRGHRRLGRASFWPSRHVLFTLAFAWLVVAGLASLAARIW
jgi:hypothetical protein